MDHSADNGLLDHMHFRNTRESASQLGKVWADTAIHSRHFAHYGGRQMGSTEIHCSAPRRDAYADPTKRLREGNAAPVSLHHAIRQELSAQIALFFRHRFASHRYPRSGRLRSASHLTTHDRVDGDSGGQLG